MSPTTSRCSTARASRSSPSGPPTIGVTAAPDERFDPFDYKEGGPPESRRRGRHRQGDRRQVRLPRGRHGHGLRRHARPSSTRSPASPRSATPRTSPARALVVFTLDEAQRVTGHDGYDDISVAAAERHVAGAAQGGDRPRAGARTSRSAPARSRPRSRRGPLRRARPHPHRAAGVRRRRAAGRRLPDLQHVHGHRRAADAGVRAAAHARRLAAAGAALGAGRDVRDRPRRVGPRHRSAACLAPAPARAARRVRARARQHQHAAASRARSSPASRSASSPRVVSGFVPARRATRVEPIEAMREAVTPTRRAPAPAPHRRRRCSSRSSASSVLLLRAVRRSRRRAAPPRPLLGFGAVLMMFGFALLAPTLVRPMSGAIGRPLERRRASPGRLARENARRQPQRTAVTASALMIGVALVVFVAIFAAGLKATIDRGHRRAGACGRHRHPRGRLLAAAATASSSSSARSTAWPPCRRSASRPASSSATARTSAITGVDPGDRHRGAPARVEAGLRTARSPSSATERRGRQPGLRRTATTLKVGDSVTFITPRGQEIAYKLAGTYDAKVGLVGDVEITNASLERDWDSKDVAFALVVSASGHRRRGSSSRPRTRRSRPSRPPSRRRSTTSRTSRTRASTCSSP